jgi:hypothetical protein
LKSALLREPLLQFLVLGAALFGLFHLVGNQKAETPARIVISSARIANLADGFARTWQRQPNKEELQGLVDDYIRDEVFYREGRAAASIATTSSSDAAFGKKWNFSLKIYLPRSRTRSSLVRISSPTRSASEPKITLHSTRFS